MQRCHEKEAQNHVLEWGINRLVVGGKVSKIAFVLAITSVSANTTLLVKHSLVFNLGLRNWNYAGVMAIGRSVNPSHPTPYPT